MNIKRSLEYSESWDWEKGEYSEYIPVPCINGYYTPSSSDLEILPIIRDLHFTYIEKVAKHYTWLNYKSQSKNSKEPIEYLKREFGQNVPSPKYETESDANSFQDMKEFDINNKELAETVREAIVQSRIGQGAFRDNLIKYWKNVLLLGVN